MLFYLLYQANEYVHYAFEVWIILVLYFDFKVFIYNPSYPIANLKSDAEKLDPILSFILKGNSE